MGFLMKWMWKYWGNQGYRDVFYGTRVLWRANVRVSFEEGFRGCRFSPNVLHQINNTLHPIFFCAELFWGFLERVLSGERKVPGNPLRFWSGCWSYSAEYCTDLHRVCPFFAQDEKQWTWNKRVVDGKQNRWKLQVLEILLLNNWVKSASSWIGC